jgi:hypothetical protein
MNKINPFNPFIPIETKLRAFKLQTPRREPVHPCSWCGRVIPINKLDSGMACGSCRVSELGKGE